MSSIRTRIDASLLSIGVSLTLVDA